MSRWDRREWNDTESSCTADRFHVPRLSVLVSEYMNLNTTGDHNQYSFDWVEMVFSLSIH